MREHLIRLGWSILTAAVFATMWWWVTRSRFVFIVIFSSLFADWVRKPTTWEERWVRAAVISVSIAVVNLYLKPGF